jgi:hypothetical protein
MDEYDAKELIAKAEVWKPELKDKVHPVYYLNVPRSSSRNRLRPEDEEVVIGADCTLTNPLASGNIPRPPTTTAISG